MRRIGLLVVAVGLLIAADEPKKSDVNKDIEGLRGSWSMVMVVINGEAAPEEAIKAGKLVVAGDHYAVALGAQSSSSTFKLDSTKSPKQIDFTAMDGPTKGQTIKGIYELVGDSFRMCRGLTPETERPAKLESKADSGHLYVVWKRSKAAEGEKTVAMREAIAEELKKFEGTWLFTSLEIEGKAFPPEGFKGSKLVLKGDKHTYTEGDNTSHGVFVVDPLAKPKTLDVTFSDGPVKGETLHAIYELDGDTYKVCIALGGKPRPTEFVSKPGTGTVLEVLKRQKP